jgi:hypothetical protein
MPVTVTMVDDDMDAMKILERHHAYSRAIDAVWRWFRRSDKPKIALSEIVERVKDRYPDADATEVRREFERRLVRSRSRRGVETR